MNQVIAFARLTKIDEAKRLVYGRAVQEVPDRVGELFDYASSKPHFQVWSDSQSEASLGKSVGNVRAMHKDVAAGIIIPGGLTFNDDECAIDVCAKITDDQEWEKCLSGTYTGFSIGGKYVKKWDDIELKKVRYTGGPSEISLVDRPCIDTATFFEIQKGDGTVLKKAFSPPWLKDKGDAPKKGDTKKDKDGAVLEFDGKDWVKKEDASVDLLKVFRSDGTDLWFSLPFGEYEEGTEFDHDGRTFQFVKMDGGKILADEVFTVEGTPAELGAFAKALSERGLKISDAAALIAKQPVPITEFAITARAVEMCKAAGGDPTDAPKLAQFRIEAEKELRKIAPRADVNPAEGKAKYGVVSFADEINKKYPIDTAAHVRAALSYIGMAKNAAKYSSDDLAKVKGRIHAKAKELGIDVGKLEKRVPNLIKGLRECGQFAYLIDSLCQLAESVEMEAATEGDASDLPVRLYNCVADLGKCLQDMVAEEVSEEVSGDADDKAVHQAQVAGVMALGERLAGLAKHLDAMVGITDEAVLTKAKELGKVDDSGLSAARDELRKAGARNSAADKKRIQAVHDHSVDLGAECGGAMASIQPVGDLKKIEGLNNELRKALDDAAALTKSLGERVAKLEAQPLPVRGMIKMVAVGKGDDHSALSAAEQLAADVRPVYKNDGSIDEVSTAMKMVLRKGGTRITMQKQRAED